MQEVLATSARRVFQTTLLSKCSLLGVRGMLGSASEIKHKLQESRAQQTLQQLCLPQTSKNTLSLSERHTDKNTTLANRFHLK